MKFGGTSMIGEMMSKSWLGSIESIELDWHEGLYVETLASRPAMIQTVHGAMHDGNPTGVYYDAKCCLCEWAYSDRKDGRPLLSTTDRSVSYGHRTPDIEGMMGWARGHRASGPHVEAVMEFRKTKRLEAAGGGETKR